MDIEAIVKKYSTCAPECSYDFDRYSAEVMLREALTELAAGYEQRLTFMKDNSDRIQQEMIARFNAAQERIRQIEAERVPAEPTTDMQAAGAQAIRFETTTINKLWTANKVYRAMLAAAPQPKKEGE